MLAQGWRPQVRDAALVTWSRVVAEQETVRARAESERRARLSGLQPNDRATWRWSGRIHYGEGVSVDPSSDLPQVLERVAEGLSVRETNFALHQGLHAHLDGGSGGVSFAYVLADDGQVDVLAYAVSSARSGNAYKWPGNGGSYTGGPLDIRAVAQHPRYQASLGLVRDRALAGAEQPAAAVPSGERPSQLADPHADLRAAILTYHQAHTALATQAAAGAEPAPAPTVGRGKKKKKKSAGSAAIGSSEQATAAPATAAPATAAPAELRRAISVLEQLGVRMQDQPPVGLADGELVSLVNQQLVAGSRRGPASADEILAVRDGQDPAWLSSDLGRQAGRIANILLSGEPGGLLGGARRGDQLGGAGPVAGSSTPGAGSSIGPGTRAGRTAARDLRSALDSAPQSWYQKAQRESASPEDCVTRVRGHLDEAYPDGIRPLRSADDIPVGSTGITAAQARLVAGPGWAGVHSLEKLEDAVWVAEAGATAVVLVSYQGDELGHALVLAKTETGARWLDPTVEGFAAYPIEKDPIEKDSIEEEPPQAVRPRAVRRAVKVWAAVLDGQGRVTEPDPGTWAGAESGSMSHALQDAPLTLDRQFGAHSFEAELHNFEIVGSDLSADIPYGTVLVWGAGVQMKADNGERFVGTNGRDYGTIDELNAAGAQLSLWRSTVVPEVVVEPWAVVNEPGRPSRQQVDAAFLQVVSILYRAKRIDGQGARLADLFRDTPYQVNPEYVDARVFYLGDVRPDAYIYLQQTVGIPMDALFQFLKDVAPEIPPNTDGKEIIESGISFGRMMGQQYVRARSGTMPGEDEVEALGAVYWSVNRLMGFMALTYIHAAAVLLFQIDMDPVFVVKSHLPVASRNSLRSGWARLGPDLQAFLRANAYEVKTEFVGHFLNTFSSFEVRYYVANDLGYGLRPERMDNATLATLFELHDDAARAQITVERLLQNPLRRWEISLSYLLDEAVAPGNGPPIDSSWYGVAGSDRGDGLEQLNGPVPLAMFVLAQVLGSRRLHKRRRDAAENHHDIRLRPAGLRQSIEFVYARQHG